MTGNATSRSGRRIVTDVLCTAISDAYRAEERSEVRDALATMLSPGQPDWSTRGVYAYWDHDTHDLLYLGLASDLPNRFAQHNGLVPHSGGNKKDEIDAYFAQRETLGFTVLLQSKAVAIWERLAEFDPTLGSTAQAIIAFGEGQLIEMHRLVHGHRPPWNKVGGSKDGKQWATAPPALLEILAARRSSLFVARKTLRELAASLKWRFFEGRSMARESVRSWTLTSRGCHQSDSMKWIRKRSSVDFGSRSCSAKVTSCRNSTTQTGKYFVG